MQLLWAEHHCYVLSLFWLPCLLRNQCHDADLHRCVRRLRRPSFVWWTPLQPPQRQKSWRLVAELGAVGFRKTPIFDPGTSQLWRRFLCTPGTVTASRPCIDASSQLQSESDAGNDVQGMSPQRHCDGVRSCTRSQCRGSF
eukprot:6460145-Amphidinium_carterae.1